MTATYDQSPGKLDLAFRRGDTFAPQVTFGLNLTGYTFTAGITTTAGSSVVSLTTALADAAIGVVTCSLTATQTAAITPGRYVWYLQWTQPGGAKFTPLAGFVEVLA